MQCLEIDQSRVGHSCCCVWCARMEKHGLFPPHQPRPNWGKSTVWAVQWSPSWPIIRRTLAMLWKPLWLITLLFGSNAVSCKQQVKKVKKNWSELEFQWVNQISIMQYLWVIPAFWFPSVAAAFVNTDYFEKGLFALRDATRRLFGDTFRKVANSALFIRNFRSVCFAICLLTSSAAETWSEARLW